MSFIFKLVNVCRVRRIYANESINHHHIQKHSPKAFLHVCVNTIAFVSTILVSRVISYLISWNKWHA